jgi:hypothetical protein
VTATDSNNDSGSDQATVHVSNLPPPTTLTSPATAAVEGQTKTYTYTVSDPGNDTYTTTESCGANGTYTNTAAANSFDCTFREGPASSTVSVQATDSDNLAGNTASTSVTVSNADPAVGALSVTDPKSGVSCLGGNTVNLGFSFTDAGSTDTHKATIAWGDGSTNTVVDPATSPVSGKQHTYSGQGPTRSPLRSRTTTVALAARTTAPTRRPSTTTLATRCSHRSTPIAPASSSSGAPSP